MAFSSQLDFVGLHRLLGLEGGLIIGSFLVGLDDRGGVVDVFSSVDTDPAVLLDSSVSFFLKERSTPEV